MIDYFKARLSERSTFVGVGAILTVALTQMSQYFTAEQNHWMAIGVTICGIAAVFTPEGKSHDAGTP